MGGRVPRAARAWPVVFGVALGVSLLAPPAPAAAHNQLTGSDPRDGARVAQAPTRIELRFLSKLDPATTKVTVTGPDNAAATGGAATFTGSRVSLPFRPGRAGLYIVGYQLRSGDGHPVSGEIRFTLTTGTPAGPPSPTAAGPSIPTSLAAPSTGPITTASPGDPSGGGSAATPVPAAGQDDGGAGSAWLWAGIAGAALVAAAGAVVLRRRSAGS